MRQKRCAENIFRIKVTLCVLCITAMKPERYKQWVRQRKWVWTVCSSVVWSNDYINCIAKVGNDQLWQEAAGDINRSTNNLCLCVWECVCVCCLHVFMCTLQSVYDCVYKLSAGDTEMRIRAPMHSQGNLIWCDCWCEYMPHLFFK